MPEISEPSPQTRTTLVKLRARQCRFIVSDDQSQTISLRRSSVEVRPRRARAGARGTDGWTIQSPSCLDLARGSARHERGGNPMSCIAQLPWHVCPLLKAQTSSVIRSGSLSPLTLDGYKTQTPARGGRGRLLQCNYS
jgi:hypothetical protein